MRTDHWNARAYEEYLNEFGVPEEEKKSMGGLIPDRCTKWGSWLRKRDPVAFNVGRQEQQREWEHLTRNQPECR